MNEKTTTKKNHFQKGIQPKYDILTISLVFTVNSFIVYLATFWFSSFGTIECSLVINLFGPPNVNFSAETI